MEGERCELGGGGRKESKKMDKEGGRVALSQKKLEDLTCLKAVLVNKPSHLRGEQALDQRSGDGEPWEGKGAPRVSAPDTGRPACTQSRDTRTHTAHVHLNTHPHAAGHVLTLTCPSAPVPNRTYVCCLHPRMTALSLVQGDTK